MLGPRITPQPVSQLRERFMEAAARSVGFVDFGPLDFIEPLEHMLDDLMHRANLSRLGHLLAPYYFKRTLTMRLRLQQAATRRDPAPVEQPLFILGLPRTGSTVLHELLALHPQLRAPTFWESHHWPKENPLDHMTKMLTRAQIAAVDVLAPTFRRIHELHALGPHECVSIQGYALRSMQFHAAFRLPTYNRWMMTGCDWTPAYRLHARYLGLLPQTGQRWVLKAPGHMLGLTELLQQYPDARFVQTHRHPAEVIPSMASLTYSLRGMTTRNRDRAEIGHDVNALWAQGLNTVLQARHSNPDLDTRFLDVHFNDFLQNPITELTRILHFAHLPIPNSYDQAARAHLQARPKNRHGDHTYSPTEFGLNEAALTDQYDDYLRFLESP